MHGFTTATSRDRAPQGGNFRASHLLNITQTSSVNRFVDSSNAWGVGGRGGACKYFFCLNVSLVDLPDWLSYWNRQRNKLALARGGPGRSLPQNKLGAFTFLMCEVVVETCLLCSCTPAPPNLGTALPASFAPSIAQGTPGFEPGTCWSAVSRSNHWAMYPRYRQEILEHTHN